MPTLSQEQDFQAIEHHMEGLAKLREARIELEALVALITTIEGRMRDRVGPALCEARYRREVDEDRLATGSRTR